MTDEHQVAKATIAVIEDEKILRELIESEIAKRGFTVVTAPDGASGWELIRAHRPKLILLDLLMPVMSGYDVLMKLRSDDELKNTPCVVISNSGQVDDLNRAYECGANDVLIKASFNPDQLIDKIEALIS